MYTTKYNVDQNGVKIKNYYKKIKCISGYMMSWQSVGISQVITMIYKTGNCWQM